jgi:hypothetical protein
MDGKWKQKSPVIDRGLINKVGYPVGFLIQVRADCSPVFRGGMVMSVMIGVRELGVHIGGQYTQVSGISQVQIVFNFERICRQPVFHSYILHGHTPSRRCVTRASYNTAHPLPEEITC